jgi:hypothetical protein
VAADVYCVLTPECWGDVRRYADPLRTATPVSCYEDHLYQTFVVGMLDFIPKEQVTLDAVPEVAKACRANVANSKLVNEAERRDDWEIWSLAPQEEDEYFFRCIFGRGTRNTPIALKQ